MTARYEITLDGRHFRYLTEEEAKSLDATRDWWETTNRINRPKGNDT